MRLAAPCAEDANPSVAGIGRTLLRPTESSVASPHKGMTTAQSEDR